MALQIQLEARFSGVKSSNDTISQHMSKITSLSTRGLTGNRDQHSLSVVMKRLFQTFKIVAVNTVVLLSWAVCPGLAEVRTITATGEYRMGDNDTRTDAKRLALLDAKRLALEQSGTYIEGIAEVKNLDVTKEEIRAYTAGIVEVIEQRTRTVLEGETTIVRVDVTSKIDTEGVASQIDALRRNEILKSQLLNAEVEASNLRKELEAKTQELATKQSREEAKVVSLERESVAKRIASNHLVQRALTIVGQNSTDEEFRQAERLIETAFEIDPSNPRAHYVLCLLFTGERDLVKALPQCRAVAALFPVDVNVHGLLGEVLFLKGDFENAITEYRTAIQLAPSSAPAYSHLGLALLKAKKRDEAANVLRHAILLDANYAAAHGYLGLVLLGESDFDGAMGEFKTALELQPNEPDYHFNLGILLVSKGKDVEASHEIREFLRLTPNRSANRDNIAKARYLLRELERPK